MLHRRASEWSSSVRHESECEAASLSNQFFSTDREGDSRGGDRVFNGRGLLKTLSRTRRDGASEMGKTIRVREDIFFPQYHTRRDRFLFAPI